jgi:hypothetical protein
MEQLVTLDLFEHSLKGARQDGAAFMLIGGLAVGYWAKRFDVFDWPGEAIYSKDIDLRGDKAASSLMAARLKEEGYKVVSTAHVKRKEPPGLGMNYVFQVDMKNLGRISVEVLEKMPLVDSPDLPPQGFAVETDGIPVLDPLSLMIGKIHAWNSRAAGQSDNDAKHLELLRRLLPSFMDEACVRGLADEIRERAGALLKILATWRTPFNQEHLESLKEELQRRARLGAA